MKEKKERFRLFHYLNESKILIRRSDKMDEQAMKEIGYILFDDIDNKTVYTTELQYEER